MIDLVSVFIWVQIQFLGLLRSSPLWLSLLLKLNTGPWHKLQLRCLGFKCCCMMYISLLLFLYLGVIICLPYPWPLILFFMPGPNISKYIIILLDKRCLLNNFSFDMLLLQIRLLMCSLKLSLLAAFFFSNPSFQLIFPLSA